MLWIRWDPTLYPKDEDPEAWMWVDCLKKFHGVDRQDGWMILSDAEVGEYKEEVAAGRESEGSDDDESADEWDDDESADHGGLGSGEDGDGMVSSDESDEGYTESGDEGGEVQSPKKRPAPSPARPRRR